MDKDLVLEIARRKEIDIHIEIKREREGGEREKGQFMDRER